MVFQKINTENSNSTIVDHSQSAWSNLKIKLNDWVDAAILNLPNFILSILIFVGFIILANLTSVVLSKLIKKTSAQESVRVITLRIYKAIIILIGFFIGLVILDLNTVLTSVLGAAGVVGLAIGLALQGTLSNTFSGIAISFMPKIQIGDWIETNGYQGFVTDINLRNVTLKTVDQNFVSIPNTKIVENPFKNYSTEDRSIAIIECGISYHSDLDFVEKITIDTVNDVIPQKIGEKVEFFYKEFGESSINYQLRFGIKETNAKDELKAKHKVIKAIKKSYDTNGITIPFPIRTIDLANQHIKFDNKQL